MKNPHIGGSVDSYMKKRGVDIGRSDTRVQKMLVAQRIELAMRAGGISKAELARMLETSRPAIDRILDPDEGVTLDTLVRVARAVGLTLKISFSGHAA